MIWIVSVGVSVLGNECLVIDGDSVWDKTTRSGGVMGFAASQARMLMLTARKSDLEIQGQFINQARLQIANIVGNLFNVTTNLEPESPQARSIQARIASIQTMDKALEIQLKRLDTQREAIMQELGAVEKVIQKNIQSSFGTFSRQS